MENNAPDLRQQLRDLNRLNMTYLLVAMTFFCFGLSLLRCIISGSKIFLFLNWNLFLAFIPWLISTMLIIKGYRRKFSLALFIFSWLLFFPNSPYILTDLFHLELRHSVPLWYDLIVIISFAWTGLLFGFVSLMDVESLLKKYFNERLIALISVVFLFLGAFGVYLGRYLRWNSWDIVSDPLPLLFDIADRFLNPYTHPGTWGMTILMGIMLNMMYFSFKLMREK